jgi:RNA polymerase sigma factor (sigma-70 family)
MQRSRRGTHLLHSFRVLFAEGSIASLSDADLIRIFLVGHGEAAEAAFETLVERHGPMVLGVSRRILRDEHAAEDAFQTVFLILARKAPEVRGDDALGRWLHGVTRRVATRAKIMVSREIPVSRTSNNHPDDPAIAALEAELRHIIGLEVARLPRKYKEVVALCHLDGLSHDAAAEALGLPVGTVRSRLSRARDLLRTRLVRRGLAPAAFAAWFAARPAAAKMPSALLETTLKTIGTDAAVAISPRVLALAQHTMRSLGMTKAIGVSVLVLALGCMATGAIALARGGDGPPKFSTQTPADPVPPAKVTPEDDPYAAVRAFLLDRPAPPVRLKHQLQASQDAPRTI